MFESIKKFFGFDADYDNRVMKAIKKFSESENLYDVQVAYIMAANRNNNLSWDEVDKIMNETGFEKEQFRDSINRFAQEIK